MIYHPFIKTGGKKKKTKKTIAENGDKISD